MNGVVPVPEPRDEIVTPEGQPRHPIVLPTPIGPPLVMLAVTVRTPDVIDPVTSVKVTNGDSIVDWP